MRFGRRANRLIIENVSNKVLLTMEDSQLNITPLWRELGVKSEKQLLSQKRALLDFVRSDYLRSISELEQLNPEEIEKRNQYRQWYRMMIQNKTIQPERSVGHTYRDPKPGEEFNFNPEIIDVNYSNLKREKGKVYLYNCQYETYVDFEKYLTYLCITSGPEALSNVSDKVLNSGGVNIHQAISDAYDAETGVKRNEEMEDNIDGEELDDDIAELMSRIKQISKPLMRHRLYDLPSFVAFEKAEPDSDVAFQLICSLAEGDYYLQLAKKHNYIKMYPLLLQMLKVRHPDVEDRIVARQKIRSCQAHGVIISTLYQLSPEISKKYMLERGFDENKWGQLEQELIGMAENIPEIDDSDAPKPGVSYQACECFGSQKYNFSLYDSDAAEATYMKLVKNFLRS